MSFHFISSNNSAAFLSFFFVAHSISLWFDQNTSSNASLGDGITGVEMELGHPSLSSPAPLNTPSRGEEQWLYFWREGPPGVCLNRHPPSHSTGRANRWLSRVASGLCALSVIKGREKVYGPLVSVLSTDGMSSKHPSIPNLQRDVMERGWGSWDGRWVWLQSAALGLVAPTTRL